jgi:hypothetical protein
MAARVSLAVVAVVVLAWLAVMERDERLLKRGVETRSVADLRDATLLNPDTGPDVGRALLYRSRDRRDDATALLEDVLRREPENLTAWGSLYLISRDGDPAAARRALAARVRLDPLDARPRPAR